MNTELETYYLARTWKRILARILDIIFASLIPGLISLIWFLTDKTAINNWKPLFIIITINYMVLILYFIIIPWKFSGQTLGKRIFLIKLSHQNNEKISFKSIALRETILVFIPITLTMLSIVLTSIFLGTNIANINEKTTSGFWINILTRTIYSFVFAWYLGIMITTKIDKKHQLFYDRKYQIYITNKHPLLKKLNSQEIKRNNNIIHIHLKNQQPGNIKQEGLDEIKDL